MADSRAVQAPLLERQHAVVGAAGIVLAAAMIGGSFAGFASTERVVPIALLLVVVATASAFLLAWRTMIASIVLVILFIPIRHYELPVTLPVAPEPYRLLVAVIALAWLSSALIDQRVRLRSTGFIEAPLFAFFCVVVVSQILNLDRVTSVSPLLVKEMFFLISFVIVLYMIVSLIRREEDLGFLICALVAGSAVVAAMAVVESRTGFNPFYKLERVIPLLREAGGFEILERGSRVRARGSAQHPLAMGAALALITPVAVGLAAARGRVHWWLAATLILVGALATVSRTAVVMLVTATVVFLAVRPQHARRWVALGLVPAVVAVHFAIPGTIGALRKGFTTERLITQSQNAPVGAGRLATFGPVVDAEFKPNPVFGEGYATRVTVPSGGIAPNSFIVDNQWLGLLLETGIAGVVALGWLFVRSLRRLFRAAKDDPTELGWLATGLCASVAAYGTAMFTFDIFSFVQVTFLFFMVLGFGGVALRLSGARVATAGSRWPS